MKLTNPLRAVLLFTALVALCCAFGSCGEPTIDQVYNTGDKITLYVNSTGVNANEMLELAGFNPDEYTLTVHAESLSRTRMVFIYNDTEHLTKEELSQLLVDVYLYAQASYALGNEYVVVNEYNETYTVNLEVFQHLESFDGLAPCVLDHIDDLSGEYRMVDNLFNCPDDW